MRIAAGIFLIIVALFNGCAGVGYVNGGKMASATADLAHDASRTEFGRAFDSAGVMSRQASSLNDAGDNLALFGYALYAVLAAQIIAAVLLFSRKGAGIVIGVGAAGLIAEAVGINMTSLGFTNVVGLIASALAIAAALTSKPANAQQVGAA